MKVTYEKFLEIFSILSNVDIHKEDKFHYAVMKLLQSYKGIYKKYNQKCFDINLKFAYEDPITRIVQKDAKGSFIYTKEEMQKREEALRVLHEQGEVEIPVYLIELTEDLKSRLDFFSLAALQGILFADQMEEHNN